MSSSQGPHPDAALSALLDGELTPDEEGAVRAHLATCEACSADLDALGSIRSRVRSLPPVQPPPGFLEDLARSGRRSGGRRTTGRHSHRRRPASAARRGRWGASIPALVATAAGAVGVLLVSAPPEAPVSPQMTRLVETHAISSSGEPPVAQAGSPLSAAQAGSPLSAAQAARNPRAVPVAHQPDSALAPGTLPDGYRRLGVYRQTEVLHLLYSDGLHNLSLFEQPGRLVLSDLPGGGASVRVGTAPGRIYGWPGGHIVIWEAGANVLTMVSDAPVDQLLRAANAVRGESPSPSVLARLRQAARALVAPLSD